VGIFDEWLSARGRRAPRLISGNRRGRRVRSRRTLARPGQPCWPQQDLVDGQAARAAEDEGDDLGDVFGGDLGLVVELLDALSGVGVGDVVRQLGGHDTWLDECHADVGQQFLPQ
jgi:hypothetical protein